MAVCPLKLDLFSYSESVLAIPEFWKSPGKTDSDWQWISGQTWQLHIHCNKWISEYYYIPLFECLQVAQWILISRKNDIQAFKKAYFTLKQTSWTRHWRCTFLLVPWFSYQIYQVRAEINAFAFSSKCHSGEDRLYSQSELFVSAISWQLLLYGQL